MTTNVSARSIFIFLLCLASAIVAGLLLLPAIHGRGWLGLVLVCTAVAALLTLVP